MLRTELAVVDSSAPTLLLGVVSPRLDDGSNGMPDKHGDITGTAEGVVTSRIDKYGSRDWRQGLLRENMSRLNTAAKRAAFGPKGDSSDTEEVAI